MRYLQALLCIIILGISTSQLKAAFPVTPLGWDNFPIVIGTPYVQQTQLTGPLTPEVNLNVSGASLFASEPFVGLAISPAGLITGAPTLYGFGIRNLAGTTTPMQVIMQAVGGDVLLRPGDAFHLSELHIDNLSPGFQGTISGFEARSGGAGGTLLNTSLSATNADYGTNVVDMIYDGVAGTIVPDLSGPPPIPSNTGTIFLTNNSGMAIDYIQFTVNLSQSGFQEFVPFGVAIDPSVPIPEPSTYLLMAGMAFICMILIRHKKANQRN